MIVALKFKHADTGREYVEYPTQPDASRIIHERIGQGYRLIDLRIQDPLTLIEESAKRLAATEEEMAEGLRKLIALGHTPNELATRCGWTLMRIEELLAR